MTPDMDDHLSFITRPFIIVFFFSGGDVGGGHVEYNHAYHHVGFIVDIYRSGIDKINSKLMKFHENVFKSE